VLDISLKEGNMREFHGDGAIGTMAQKMTFEGPILKDRTSFIVSARRTMLDLLFFAYSKSLSKINDPVHSKLKMDYNFYDITAKINHRFSDKNRIYLSAYLGNDKLNDAYKRNFPQNQYYTFSGYNNSVTKLKWGTFLSTLRWNHVVTNRLFCNTTMTYSRYRFNPIFLTETERIYYDYAEFEGGIFDVDKTNSAYDFIETQNHSDIQDWSVKTSFDYLPSSNHYIRFGINATHHAYIPNAMFFHTISELKDFINDQRIYDHHQLNFGSSRTRAYEYSAYIEDDIRLSERLKTNIGVHWSVFAVEGKFYSMAQPRISARFLINPQLSVKASYVQMAQYNHMISNLTLGVPVDIFVPSTELLVPEKSNQAAIGLAHEFRNEYEISLEGYYKTMSNVVEFKDGTNMLNMNERWDQQLLQGSGRSYGSELFIQKKTGANTGWIGYTLSWTDRHFDELNGGKRFPYTYDRRHDLSVAYMRRFDYMNVNDKKTDVELSATWVFSSGHLVTVPAAGFDMRHPFIREGEDTKWIRQYDYSERNNYRMSPTHRLDLSIAFVKQKKWGETRFVMSLINVYFSSYFSYMDVARKSLSKYMYKETKMKVAIPSLSYQVKF